jgi:hypothetical protein
MNGYPSCKSCACFFRNHAGARTGQCRARSPVPIMIGVSQMPSLPSIIGAKNGAGNPQPVINGFFPPVDETVWCMDWQPLAEETDNKTIEHEATA